MNSFNEVIASALNQATADQVELLLSSHSQSATRWANNAITQNIAKTDEKLTVKAAFGNRVGTTSTNVLDEESLKRVVEKAEAIAKASEPDTEHMPPVEPMEYPKVQSFHQTTADSTPQQRADAIRQAIELCESSSLRSAGSYTVETELTTVANSRGLFATHPSSYARFVVTGMTEDSSGWAEAISNNVAELDVKATADIAIQKAIAARRPVEIDPGRYTVILAPAAVAEILEFMVWSMDAKAAHEGRSAFTEKEGTTIAAPTVNLRTQPDHPLCPGSPFFDDGMPAPTVSWIEGGILKNLCYSRFWAKEKDHPFTGTLNNVIMDGANMSTALDTHGLANMIGSTDQGLLVTRFWYVRYVDPMKLLLTGMTRDGLFLIRDGAIAGAVKNLRFNETPFNMLQNIETLGIPQRCGEYVPCYVPRLKVRDFNFTSGTTF